MSGPSVFDPVRFSNLKRIARSPAHYKAGGGKEATHLQRGSALHSLVLGGPRVVAYEGAVRRGAAWEAFKANNPDALILTETEYGKTFAMAAAVHANPVAMAALEGQHELEINWKFLKRDCQSHLDVLGHDGKYITELKTCADGQPDRFARAALRYGYPAQLAFYCEAARQAGLGDPREAYVVTVESAAPHVVTTMRLTERALEQGAKMFRLWFERLLACELANEWGGYCASIVPLDVPEDDPELIFGSSGEVAETSEAVPF